MLLWIFAYKFFCGYMVSILLGIHFRGRIGGSCAHCMFNILRNCQTVFLSGCTILHSYQQCMMVPNSLHLCQHLLLYVLLVIPTHSSTLAWKIPWILNFFKSPNANSLIWAFSGISEFGPLYWSQIILCWGGWVRALLCNPCFYPPHASSTLPPYAVTTKNVSRHCKMFPGGKITLS